MSEATPAPDPSQPVVDPANGTQVVPDSAPAPAPDPAPAITVDETGQLLQSIVAALEKFHTDVIVPLEAKVDDLVARVQTLATSGGGGATTTTSFDQAAATQQIEDALEPPVDAAGNPTK